MPYSEIEIEPGVELWYKQWGETFDVQITRVRLVFTSAGQAHTEVTYRVKFAEDADYGVGIEHVRSAEGLAEIFGRLGAKKLERKG